MRFLNKTVIAIILLLLVTIVNAQIKNGTTKTVKIYGNCAVCKAAIENAGNLKKIAKVNWNKETMMATLTYNNQKTNQEEILKRIALAGYDSEKFLAPEDAYSKLPVNCHYNREAKIPVKVEIITTAPKTDTTEYISENQERNQLKAVFDNYFLLKDALVKTDSKTAAAKSKELLMAINDVNMETLKMDVHMVWMKVLKALSAEVSSISETLDIEKQRDAFKPLSKDTYELIKVTKPTETIYYQYCPMQDANWLSKENAVKNPYYGAQMLTCGKTIEIIK